MVITVATICQLALYTHLRSVETILGLLMGLIMLFIHCFICNTIPKNYQNLIKKLESHKINDEFDSYNSEDRLIISQLQSLIPKMVSQPLVCFKSMANTFLSCITVIISYSVIIIQT